MLHLVDMGSEDQYQVAEDTPIRDAVRLLCKKRIHAVSVCNEQGVMKYVSFLLFTRAIRANS